MIPLMFALIMLVLGYPWLALIVLTVIITVLTMGKR